MCSLSVPVSWGSPLPVNWFKREFLESSIIEKESGLGKHASGRNSGVLHAGIYYSPDSMKARSCLNGNFLMKEYCRRNNLPLIETGKVIVARSESELPTLHELYDRAVSNGAKVDMIDEKAPAWPLNPNAFTVKEALFSHFTRRLSTRNVSWSNCACGPRSDR